MSQARIGEQLELQLEGDVLVDPRRLPWGGRSPRALTRVALRGILKAQADKSVSNFVDPEQYDLWLPIKKAPWQYEGAPLLRSLS